MVRGISPWTISHAHGLQNDPCLNGSFWWFWSECAVKIRTIGSLSLLCQTFRLGNMGGRGGGVDGAPLFLAAVSAVWPSLPWGEVGLEKKREVVSWRAINEEWSQISQTFSARNWNIFFFSCFRSWNYFFKFLHVFFVCFKIHRGYD